LVGAALLTTARVHELIVGNTMATDLKPDEKPIRQPPTPKWPSKLDELLDEALEETFPASDAVSLSQPKRSVDKSGS
jgi:hypothetical protein